MGLVGVRTSVAVGIAGRSHDLANRAFPVQTVIPQSASDRLLSWRLLQYAGEIVRTLQIIVLFLFLILTGALYAQTQTPYNQAVIDAVQNQRIETAEQNLVAATSNLTALTRELSELRSSLDRFTGIGIGIGACLTALQALLVIITVRNGKK